MNPAITQGAGFIEAFWRQSFDRRWDWDDPTDAAPNHQQRLQLCAQVNILWRCALNWATLVELNRRWVERRLPTAAGSDFPPNIEDANSTRNILRLHDYGLIPTQWCPGWQGDLQRQRAFLHFSMSTTQETVFIESRWKVIIEFVVRLNATSEIRSFVRWQYNDPLPGVQRSPKLIDFLERRGRNIPDCSEEAFTAEGWDLDEDEQGNPLGFRFVQQQTRSDVGQPWGSDGESKSNRINVFSSHFQDDSYKIPASWAVDPLQICVVARDWDYRGIEGLIENAFRDAGARDVYPSQNQ